MVVHPLQPLQISQITVDLEGQAEPSPPEWRGWSWLRSLLLLVAGNLVARCGSQFIEVWWFLEISAGNLRALHPRERERIALPQQDLSSSRDWWQLGWSAKSQLARNHSYQTQPGHHSMICSLMIHSRNQTWLAGNSTVNGSFQEKFTCKGAIFHCHVWLPQRKWFVPWTWPIFQQLIGGSKSNICSIHCRWNWWNLHFFFNSNTSNFSCHCKSQEKSVPGWGVILWIYPERWASVFLLLLALLCSPFLGSALRGGLALPHVGMRRVCLWRTGPGVGSSPSVYQRSAVYGTCLRPRNEVK